MRSMRARLTQPRTIALAVWLAAFSIATATSGLPTKRGNVLLWMALLVVAIGVERPRATLRSFVTTWLPLFAALGAYDLLRGMSDDSSQAAAHTWPQMDVDLWLGGGELPATHLQRHLWDAASPAWYDYASWVVYQSHFFVPLVVAIALWSLRDRMAPAYVLALAATSWLALATYFLYPAQPPWMVARDGLVDGHVARVVQHMWQDIGVDRAARVFTTSAANANRYSNPVAALPSLHAALPMLAAVVLWGRRRWLDALLGCYVLAMAWALVYGGEHFLFDIWLGWAYALAVGVTARVLVRRRYAIEPIVPATASDDDVPHADAAGTGGSHDELAAASERSRSTRTPQTTDASS
jgi:hypothetical protein